MSDVLTLDDLSLLVETVELECKLAQGQDGKGELPKDFWATYSAFANTHGGVVLLGVREKSGQFSAAGLSNIEKVRTDLFNTLNNPAKVSINLLSDDDVRARTIDGQQILEIHIPAATRKQRPVFLNGQPFGNTYRRLHEGDRRCDEESIKRMFAEQVEDSRDERILPNFDFGDIDPDSLRIYRQMLSDHKQGHPALELQGVEFLRQIGGWRRDRATGQEGLTLAGLLMFGRWLSIQEAVPHYFVDYQERPQAKTELRWIDRIAPDGSWSGNLFDFYRRVYRKLIADLKVPFQLKGDQRQDDTPVHEALREALVNTLVHADYTGRVPVLVVKRPDLFGFRNPGGLRLPLEQVLQGGVSDCRNRLMHQMFLMIGLGERGGSGVPKIYSGWRSQDWRPPALYEKDEPEQTVLELRMLDLLPADIVGQLRKRFGQRFDQLEDTARLILATAAIERVVNHNRLLELCDFHPHDLSLLLSRLVKEGMLVSDGRSRGMVYHLPGEVLPTPEQVFEGPAALFVDSVPLVMRTEAANSGSEHLGLSSEHLGLSSEHLGLSSEHLSQSSEQWDALSDSSRDAYGRWVSPHLEVAVIDSLDCLDKDFRKRLEEMASEPRQKKKLVRERMRQILLVLCKDQFMSLSALARLVGRNPDALRQQYLNEMVRNRQILLAFPSRPTHERQAYRASDEGV